MLEVDSYFECCLWLVYQSVSSRLLVCVFFFSSTCQFGTSLKCWLRPRKSLVVVWALASMCVWRFLWKRPTGKPWSWRHGGWLCWSRLTQMHASPTPSTTAWPSFSNPYSAWAEPHPAYRLSRRQGPDTFVVCYRVYVGDPQYSCLGDGHQVTKVGIVPTPAGTVTLSVAYRTKMLISPQQSTRDLTADINYDHFKSDVTSPRRMNSARPCHKVFRDRYEKSH